MDYAVASGWVIRGADLSGLNLDNNPALSSDGLHFTTDLARTLVATAWADVLAPAQLATRSYESMVPNYLADFLVVRDDAERDALLARFPGRLKVGMKVRVSSTRQEFFLDEGGARWLSAEAIGAHPRIVAAATRPDASTMPGQVVFNTTTKRENWSDGFAWWNTGDGSAA